MAPSGGSRVARNVVVGTAGRVFIVVLGLIVTPTLLTSLGPERFGLFTILTSFQSYFGVLDLGIGGGLVRFMTIYSERGDSRIVRAITSFGCVYYFVLAVIAIPGVFLAAPAMAAWLEVEPSLMATTIHAIYAVFGLFIVSSISGVITARLYSIHRMDIVSATNIISGVVYVLAVIIFLPLYPNTDTAILCLYLQVFVLLIISSIYVIRLTPGALMSNPFSTPRALLGELFSFGFWTQINNISAIINLEADKLIIGRYLGVAEVTPYQVGGRFAMLTRALPLQILTAMFPDVTARLAKFSGIAEVSEIYRSGTRTLMLVTLVSVGFPIAVSSSLIHIWIGYVVPAAASIAIALMVSYSVNNATGVGTLILRAMGIPKYETVYAVVSAVLNIAITIILLPHFGIYGIVYGTICGNVISSIGFIFFFHRIFKLGFNKSLFSWLCPLAASVIIAAGVVYGLQLIAIPTDIGRFPELLLICLLGVVYLLLVFELLKILKFWTSRDLVAFRRFGVVGRWLAMHYSNNVVENIGP